MKTNLFFKLAGGVLLVATVVVIGCSKKASTSSLSEEVVSGAVKQYSTAHFTSCPNTNVLGVYDPANLTYDPEITQWGFTGGLAGCGNSKNVELNIVASITVFPWCYNKSENKIIPGQSKVFTRTIKGYYKADANGNITFNEKTTPILLSDLSAKGDKYICPNLGNWTLLVHDSQLNSWTITLDGKEVSKYVGQTVCN